MKVQTAIKWFGLSRLIGSVLSLIAVALAGWWLLRVPPPPPEDSIPIAGTVTTLSVMAISPQTQELVKELVTEITVHIAGAVKTPGVYQFHVGARINDGVVAAGGATAQADLDSVNLAMLLSEGEQIYIPKRNDKPHIIVQPRFTSSNSSNSSTNNELQISININTATAIELEQLAGVGPSTAKAIIEFRQKNGGFKTVEDLLNVRGIGPAKLSEILPQARVN
ncbi:MAG: helix-hairpin-helix domain-containing protein [Actinobacteria bacterium]|nr:helix-hairpin-helix domain-containing protein [Actinomycetota bacterium]